MSFGLGLVYSTPTLRHTLDLTATSRRRWQSKSNKDPSQNMSENRILKSQATKARIEIKHQHQYEHEHHLQLPMRHGLDLSEENEHE